MGDDAANVWRAAVGAWSYGYSDDPGEFESVATEGVWRPLAADQRRDRIVRAAEAWHDSFDDYRPGAFQRKEEAHANLIAAVAAGRETT